MADLKNTNRLKLSNPIFINKASSNLDDHFSLFGDPDLDSDSDYLIAFTFDPSALVQPKASEEERKKKIDLISKFLECSAQKNVEVHKGKKRIVYWYYYDLDGADTQRDEFWVFYDYTNDVVECNRGNTDVITLCLSRSWSLKLDTYP